MEPLLFKSKKDISQLSLYQKMFECFASAALLGGKYLDLMNYSKKVYKPVLDLKAVENIFQSEHGYTVPDGSIELGDLIKGLEISRLVANCGMDEEKAKDIVSKTAIGVGHGVTGVYSGVFYAIRKINNKKEVIAFRPSYPAAEDIAGQYGYVIKPLQTMRENSFLPTFEQIKLACNSNTAAIVLVYPNNPTFTTFKNKEELKRIADFCQSNQIFLITDNIYQEMKYNGDKHIEVLSLVDTPNFIIKLFGPSKDRPFFTGHRLGYFIGDNRISEEFFDFCCRNFVCLTTFQKNIFSFDLLFRMLIYKKIEQVRLEDIAYLRDWMFGINQKIMFERILKSRIFEKYKRNLEINSSKLQQSMRALKRFIKKSVAFEDIVNGNGGNAIFVKVNHKYFSGDDLQLYEDFLRDKKIAIYPGNVFGMKMADGSVWFRMTAIHDTKEEILKLLREFEEYLISKQK